MAIRSFMSSGFEKLREYGFLVLLGKIIRLMNKRMKFKLLDFQYWSLRVRSKDGYLLREIQGSQMLLDLNDYGISKDLTFNDIREDIATHMMHEVLKDGDVVVDVGANIGYYALMEAKLVGDEGAVYAIEPVPRNFKLLEKNVSINKYRSIELYHHAIGDYDGKSTMYISPLSNWHAMNDISGTGKTIEVDVFKLDTFLKDKPYPSLIRMDVEGFEYQILQGLKDTLAEDKPLILFIEYHPHIMKREKSLEFLEQMKSSGFFIRLIANRAGVQDLSIDDLMMDEENLAGKTGGFLVFFER